MKDQAEHELKKLFRTAYGRGLEGYEFDGPHYQEYEKEFLQLIAQAHKGYDDGTTLQPFEVQDYKRLKALESRGIDEYRKMREETPLSAERVVSFINQLSPWNLATTGISTLQAYTQADVDRAVADLPVRKFKGEWGITSLLQLSKALEVAENGGDIKECSDALRAILKELRPRKPRSSKQATPPHNATLPKPEVEHYHKWSTAPGSGNWQHCMGCDKWQRKPEPKE